MLPGSDTKDTLYFNTILVDSPGLVSGGTFVDYLFKKESGKWKMHDVKYTKIGKLNFELPPEMGRAEKCIRIKISVYHSNH